MSPVIDVHTHMLNDEWLKLLEKHGRPRYTLKAVTGGLRAIHLDGAPFMTPVPEMFDWDLRIKNMTRVGIDVSVVSLTCPNVYWGGEAVSLKAAQVMNDEMAKARKTWPDRIQWFCSLPWQYEKAALAELKRSLKAGACGVMVLANIGARSLTDPAFAKIWQAIDAAKLPVLIHPTAPPGVKEMEMADFQLVASIGFTTDTTLAVARMIYDGFFDRFQKLKIIASHGGGTLPYLIGRMDQCYEHIPACRTKTREKPSLHARRIYADAVVFTDDALAMAVQVFGSGNVLYGSDYPHTIGDPIGCLARVDRLPDGARSRVRGGNALRYLRLQMTIYHQGTARTARDLPLTQDEREARLQLAACYRIFNHLGWTEMIFNHITLRVPGPEKLFLINPFGLHYSEITASNLLLIDIDGNPVREAKWPVNRAGFVIHSAIHGAIAEARCVMHTHTTTGMAVACQKGGLSPTNFYAAQLHGGVAYHDFEGITVEEDEKVRLVASIGDKRAVILRNHGLLAWGPSVPEAFMTLWTLQRACDVQIASSSAGALNPIESEVFAQTVRESGPGEKRACEDVFAAMQRLVDAKDPSYRN